MNVFELVKRLKRLPPSAEVSVFSVSDIDDVEIWIDNKGEHVRCKLDSVDDNDIHKYSRVVISSDRY